MVEDNTRCLACEWENSGGKKKKMTANWKEIELELFRVDVPDDEHEIITTASAARAIQTVNCKLVTKEPFEELRSITVYHDTMTYVGELLGLRLDEETGWVMARMLLSKIAQDLVIRGFEATMVGCCASDVIGTKDKPRTLRDFELVGVSLTPDKISYVNASEGIQG